jgi:hypothetical protein
MQTATASRALAPHSHSALTLLCRSHRYVITQLIAGCASPGGPCAGITVRNLGSRSCSRRNEAA